MPKQKKNEEKCREFMEHHQAGQYMHYSLPRRKIGEGKELIWRNNGWKLKLKERHRDLYCSVENEKESWKMQENIVLSCIRYPQ